MSSGFSTRPRTLSQNIAVTESEALYCSLPGQNTPDTRKESHEQAPASSHCKFALRASCFVGDHVRYHIISRFQNLQRITINYLNYHGVHEVPNRRGVGYPSCNYPDKYQFSSSSFDQHSLIRNDSESYHSSRFDDYSDSHLKHGRVLDLRTAGHADRR
jgi:hypothetical protein